MTDKKRDLVCSLLFLVFGIFTFVEAMGIHPIMERDLGSGFVPKIIAGAIIATALVKLILTVAGQKAEGKKAADQNTPKQKNGETKKEDQGDLTGGLLTIAALLVYAVLFKPVGFIVSTILYLFAQITILSNESNRNLPLFGVISVVASVAIYIIFVHVIKMPLPAGLVGF